MHATEDVSSARPGVQTYAVPSQDQSPSVVRQRGAQVLHPQGGQDAAVLPAREWKIGSLDIPKSWGSTAMYAAGMAFSLTSTAISWFGVKNHSPVALQNLGYIASVASVALKIRDAAVSIAHATHGTAGALPKVPRAAAANGVMVTGGVLTVIGMATSPGGMNSYVSQTSLTAGSSLMIQGVGMHVRDGLILAAHHARGEQAAPPRFSPLTKNRLENTSIVVGLTLSGIASAAGTFSPEFGATFVPAALEIAGGTFVVLGAVPKVRDAVVAIARVLHDAAPIHPMVPLQPEVAA